MTLYTKGVPLFLIVSPKGLSIYIPHDLAVTHPSGFEPELRDLESPVIPDYTKDVLSE